MELDVAIWLLGLFGSILLILLRQQVLNNQKTNEILADLNQTMARHDERIKNLEKKNINK